MESPQQNVALAEFCEDLKCKARPENCEVTTQFEGHAQIKKNVLLTFRIKL